MSKKTILIVIVSLIIAVTLSINKSVKNHSSSSTPSNSADIQNIARDSFKQIVQTDDSITTYFGNEASGDLDGDGKADIAYLITQEGGGSGLFYYAVVALKTDTGYKLTNLFFIGDRIAPQSTYISESVRELHINYAERKNDEPMTVAPSVGAVKLLKVTPDGVLEGLMK